MSISNSANDLRINLFFVGGFPGDRVSSMQMNHIDPQIRYLRDLIDNFVRSDGYMGSYFFGGDHSRRREIENELFVFHLIPPKPNDTFFYQFILSPLNFYYSTKLSFLRWSREGNSFYGPQQVTNLIKNIFLVNFNFWQEILIF